MPDSRQTPKSYGTSYKTGRKSVDERACVRASEKDRRREKEKDRESNEWEMRGGGGGEVTARGERREDMTQARQAGRHAVSQHISLSLSLFLILVLVSRSYLRVDS